MSWEYRVIRKEYYVEYLDSWEQYFAIQEVYYNEIGEIDGWTDSETIRPQGASFKELCDDLSYFQQALLKPVLTVVSVNGKEKLVEWKE